LDTKVMAVDLVAVARIYSFDSIVGAYEFDESNPSAAVRPTSDGAYSFDVTELLECAYNLHF
jgi:hypothetical protein